MNKLVILDRDGVINYDSDEYIKSPEEWQPLPGSCEAITALNKADFKVVIITNQSGIGRGLYTKATLNKIHEKMSAVLKTHGAHIDKIYICPHAPSDHCDCRKPKTALFLQAAKDFNIDLNKTYYIADKTSDLQAGHAAGCQNILVLTGYGQKTLARKEYLDKVIIKNDLADAVNYINGNPVN